MLIKIWLLITIQGFQTFSYMCIAYAEYILPKLLLYFFWSFSSPLSSVAKKVPFYFMPYLYTHICVNLQVRQNIKYSTFWSCLYSSVMFVSSCIYFPTNSILLHCWKIYIVYWCHIFPLSIPLISDTHLSSKM